MHLGKCKVKQSNFSEYSPSKVYFRGNRLVWNRKTLAKIGTNESCDSQSNKFGIFFIEFIIDAATIIVKFSENYFIYNLCFLFIILLQIIVLFRLIIYFAFTHLHVNMARCCLQIQIYWH